MKIFVAGAGGMLGGKVVQAFASAHDVVASTRRGEVPCDVEDAASVAAALDAHRPDAVVNCAAWTAVDACESEPARAHRANAEAAGILARACAERGLPLLHFSTDYVFDGERDGAWTEDDEPRPKSVYGHSKLAGELEVRAAGGAWTILRVQWLYGAGGPSFADTILRLAREQPVLRVVDDQHGAPTWTGDLATQTVVLVESGLRGLYHCSPDESTTWYGFARALLEAEGLGDHPIEPVTSDAFPRPAPRPRNSVLDNARLKATGLWRMPTWPEGMRRFIREDRARPAPSRGE